MELLKHAISENNYEVVAFMNNNGIHVSDAVINAAIKTDKVELVKAALHPQFIITNEHFEYAKSIEMSRVLSQYMFSVKPAVIESKINNLPINNETITATIKRYVDCPRILYANLAKLPALVFAEIQIELNKYLKVDYFAFMKACIGYMDNFKECFRLANMPAMATDLFQQDEYYRHLDQLARLSCYHKNRTFFDCITSLMKKPIVFDKSFVNMLAYAGFQDVLEPLLSTDLDILSYAIAGHNVSLIKYLLTRGFKLESINSISLVYVEDYEFCTSLMQDELLQTINMTAAIAYCHYMHQCKFRDYLIQICPNYNVADINILLKEPHIYLSKTDDTCCNHPVHKMICSGLKFNKYTIESNIEFKLQPGSCHHDGQSISKYLNYLFYAPHNKVTSVYSNWIFDYLLN